MADVRLRLATVAVGVGLAALGSGCGGDDDSSESRSAGSGGESASPRGQSEDPAQREVSELVRATFEDPAKLCDTEFVADVFIQERGGAEACLEEAGGQEPLNEGSDYEIGVVRAAEKGTSGQVFLKQGDLDRVVTVVNLPGAGWRIASINP